MRPAGFHPRAWLLWLGASVLVVTSLSNPFVTGVALVALGAVSAGFAATGPEGRGFGLFLRLGMIFLLVRVVLFGLTGHTGNTTLLSLPELALPRWLGGFTLGGRVTAEVLSQSGAEGLRLAAFLACFGTFVAVADVYRVLRMVPRFLSEAALVVSIGITTVPTILRTATDVRDAQRLRGHRARGIRSSAAIVVPVIAGGVERAVTLAESMEARGYGRRVEGAHRGEARARAAVLASIVAMAAGGALSMYGRGPASLRWSVLAAAGGGLAAGLRALSHLVPRTRLAPDRMDGWDVALAGAALGIAVAAAVGARWEPSSWYPYPNLAAPALDLRLVAIAASLAAPNALGAARALHLARAGRRAPILPDVAEVAR